MAHLETLKLEHSFEERKKAFLSHYGEYYGLEYPPNSSVDPKEKRYIDQIFETEFQRISDAHLTYLDHTGTTLYSKTQLSRCFKLLESTAFGNPHSVHPAADNSALHMKHFRQEILSFFNTNSQHYSVIFTLNASEALRELAESFVWTPESSYFYPSQAHNSLVGIRAVAKAAGSKTTKLSSFALFSAPFSEKKVQGEKPIHSLVGITGQCNFSGRKIDGKLISGIQNSDIATLDHLQMPKDHTYHVLLDAAAMAPTSPFDLSKYDSDFVVFSFYKVFGYPTGLGALLVHHRAKNLIKTPNFWGGGNVSAVTEKTQLIHKNIIKQHERGTSPFLTIAEARIGLDWIKNLCAPYHAALAATGLQHWNPSMYIIRRHVLSLSSYLETALDNISHSNGHKMCLIYARLPGKPGIRKIHEHFAGIVSFQLMDTEGNPIPRVMVEQIAGLSNICIRSGCFCNYGSCQDYIGLSDAEVLKGPNFVHESGAREIFGCTRGSISVTGKPYGALRASIGYMTRFEDVDNLVQFLVHFFKDLGYQFVDHHAHFNLPENKPIAQVSKIFVYPVKSCAPIDVSLYGESWPLSETGFLLDRNWMLVDQTGAPLKSRNIPKMVLITPKPCLQTPVGIGKSPCSSSSSSNTTTDSQSETESQTPIWDCKYLSFSFPGQHDLSFAIDEYAEAPVEFTPSEWRPSNFKHYSPKVSSWFSTCLGQKCFLVRQVKPSTSPTEHQTSFTKTSQFLLTSSNSVHALNAILDAKLKVSSVWFRPNIEISPTSNNLLVPFIEDELVRNFSIGKVQFTGTSLCARCQSVNVDPNSGTIGQEPLLSLLQYRRKPKSEQVLFGVNSKMTEFQPGSLISIGDFLTLPSQQI